MQNTKQKKLFVFADVELFLKSAYNYQSHVVIYIANQIVIYNRINQSSANIPAQGWPNLLKR